MAITAEALQTALGENYGYVSKHDTIDATYDMFYVTSGAGGPQAGKSCWCRTTSAGNAAAQAAEVVTALTEPGPVDPLIA